MSNSQYSALAVVSPMFSGGEAKNQDRARWYGSTQIACVCDGVSSSPFSAEAAEYLTMAIPPVFCSDINKRLEMAADILLKQRIELCANMPVIQGEKYTLGMQQMLLDVVRQKNTSSFQTTLIAIRISGSRDSVIVDLIKCGDSAFFAFSKDGALLSSSLQFSSQLSVPIPAQKHIIFGPGDEMLVRIEGRLCEYMELAKQSGISPEFVKNWMVCTPIDSCKEMHQRVNNLLEIKTLCLTEDDRLIVPEYLYGKNLSSRGRQYKILNFSTAIKALPRLSEISKSGFNGKSSATNVFPDHFYSGNYDLFRDSFPAGTNFVLCSDGFYSAFDDFDELHSWLKINEQSLSSPHHRVKMMEGLHSQLSTKSSDDDISFIWATPCGGDNNG